MSKDIFIQSCRDHIASLSAATPLKALEELVWNALDADATEVKIDLVTNPLGGIDAVRVSDNGTGIDILKVENTFGGIGGSWKRTSGRTPGAGRRLHGRRGKGRFKAFALGSHVEWRTTMASAEGGLISYAIVGDSETPEKFAIEDARSTGPAAGTEVVATNVRAGADSLADAAETVQALASAFALYLKSYPDVSVYFCGIPVSPVIVQKSETELPLEGAPDMKLKVIEWRRRMAGGGRLVFCGSDGFALHETSAGVRPGFASFTAYLVSPRFAALAAENLLEMEELAPEVRRGLDAARAALRAHVRARCLEEDRGRFDAWLAEGSYPYASGDDSSGRWRFDEAARKLRSRLDGFDAMAPSERKAVFGLLKAALDGSGEKAVEAILG